MNGTSFRNALILAVVLLGVGPLVVLAITIDFLAADRSQTVRLGWDTSLGSWEAVMRRFPATRANALALELERQAATLGIDLAPNHLHRAPAVPEARKAVDQLKRQVFGRYSSEQLEQVQRGRLDAPPPLLVDYIGTYERVIEDLCRRLTRGDLAVWESDLSRLIAAPLPNLAGQLDLHKLLVSVALAQLHAGDTPRALRSVEASWNLSRSLRDSPLLISQLIYIAATRLQIGVLRHVRDLPDDWIARLREHDLRRSFITALKVEGWIWLHVDTRPMPGGPGVDWWERLALTAIRPYGKLCLAELSDRWRKDVARLERIPAICDRDLAAEGADMDIRLSRWNKIGKLAGLDKNMAGTVGRVARLELDRELLLVAAQADAARLSTGAWPSPDTREQRSTACPDDRWVYQPRAGHLEIAFSRELSWPEQFGPILPQRIVLE